MFNGQYGFIQYSSGSIFFHKSSIEKNSLISFNSRVSFKIKPSERKKDKHQATNVTLLEEDQMSREEMNNQASLHSKKIKDEESDDLIHKYRLGVVKWDHFAEYGVILSNKKEYFFRQEDVKKIAIREGYKCIFQVKKKDNYKKIAYNIFWLPDLYFEDSQDIILDEELFCSAIFEHLNKIELIDGDSVFASVCQLIDILIEFKKETDYCLGEIYKKSSKNYKFHLWKNGYTNRFELENISRLICEKYNSPYSNRFIIDTKELRKSILNKLIERADHLAIIDQLISEIKSIQGYIARYDIIEIMSDLNSLAPEEKEYFYSRAYEICDDNCKFQMWDAGYVTQNDINIILENIPPYLEKFELTFKRLKEDEKFLFLKKSIRVFHETDMRWSGTSSINKLFQIEEVMSFVDSDGFKVKIKSSKGSDIFWFLWYLESDSINADFITNELSVDEFISYMRVAKRLDKDCFIKIETFYQELPVYLKLKLWINDLFGSLDYIEFSKAFHELNVEDRKLFNKKVKEHAHDEQIKSFIDQIPKAELVEDNSDQKIYKCKWRNIYFKYQRIQVFLSKKELTTDFYCSFSRPELNLLTQEYFSNRRIDDIYVTLHNDNSIKTIEGLDSIETQIIFAEIRKNGSTEARKSISNEEIIRMIHNVGERNKCIRFLNEQNSPYNVVDIQELVTEVYGGLRRDISFLYCLPDNNDSIYLVWESVEFEKSKATHIFKCKAFEVDDYIDEIKKFLESTIHSRSKLNSSEIEDVDQKKKLKYFGRVIHDSKDYEVWEERMKSTLPFLI